MKPPDSWSGGCEYPFLPASSWTTARPERGQKWPIETLADGSFRWRTGREMSVTLRGKAVQPIYWTDNGAAELLVTTQVRSVIEEEGLTGCEFRSVKVLGEGQVAPPALWQLFAVTPAGTDPSLNWRPVTPEEEARARSERLPSGVPLIEGQSIPDFFHLDQQPLWIGLSSRAARLFLKNRWTPFVLWRLDRYPRRGGFYSEGRFVQDIFRLVDRGFTADQAFDVVREGYSRMRGGAPRDSEAWNFLLPIVESLREQQMAE